jgi:hypothetical protein
MADRLHHMTQALHYTLGKSAALAQLGDQPSHPGIEPVKPKSHAAIERPKF